MKKIYSLIVPFLIVIGSVYSQQIDGYALYNSLNSTTTYLIDREGDIAKSWSLDLSCNYAVLLMENGNIMRGGVNNANQINGAAVGGIIQEIDPNSNVVWEFVYSTSDYVSHHDITLMPNGGVLLTAWEVKNSTELDAAGYTGNSNTKWPTHFIEVQPDGTGGGQIVWEWHIWDHLCQDVDQNKPNYMVVSDHPELMDINVAVSGGGPGGPGGGGGDWFHVNGVNYNADLDQIVFSSRFLSEIFIIDHSTTTAEAASHTGGNAGKGGDFLYRWGKPSNFGGSGAQQIAGAVHDARWITNDGRPRGGFIQFFNNVGGSGGSSVVDAIDPPLAMDGYNYTFVNGVGFEPLFGNDWRHNCIDDAGGQSASNSMSNGNIFVNLSGSYMYEQDTFGNLIWQYNSNSAKAFRYECDYPGIVALMNPDCNCDPDGTAYVDSCGTCVEGLTGLKDCNAVSVNEEKLTSFSLYPNPTSGILNIDGLQNEKNYSIQVSDIYGNKVYESASSQGLNLSSLPQAIYLVSIQLENGARVSNKINIIR